jgi:hypothetical protein
MGRLTHFLVILVEQDATHVEEEESHHILESCFALGSILAFPLCFRLLVLQFLPVFSQFCKGLHLCDRVALLHLFEDLEHRTFEIHRRLLRPRPSTNNRRITFFEVTFFSHVQLGKLTKNVHS